MFYKSQMEIKHRQTVVVHRNLASVQQTFSEPLNLDFTPNVVVVRNVSCSTGGGLGMHAVIVPWVHSNQNILCVFADRDYDSSPQIHYRIEDGDLGLNGDAKFDLRLIGSSVTASVATCRLVITLEFQRHEVQRSFDDVMVTTMQQMSKMMFSQNPQGNVYPFQLPKGAQFGKGSSFMVDPSEEPIPDVHPRIESSTDTDGIALPVTVPEAAVGPQGK